MNFNVIGHLALLYLEDQNNHIAIDDTFRLTGNQEYLVKNIMSDDLFLSMGKIALSSFLKPNSHYFYGHFNLEGGVSDKDIYEYLENYAGYFQGVLLSLWFIKDNSVNIPSVYLHSLSSDTTIRNTKSNMFSTSKGEYINTIFTSQEILQAISWNEKISLFLTIDKTENEMLESIDNENLDFKNNNKNIPYDQFGRVPRALTFLQFARKESFLPLKITGYVGVLETLFSTNNEEVTHQIAERVSLFLEDNPYKRIENYKFIKKIYGIRSSYVHGSKFNNNKYAEMETLCPDLDELVRRIMKKVLTKNKDIDTASANEINTLFLNKIFNVSKE